MGESEYGKRTDQLSAYDRAANQDGRQRHAVRGSESLAVKLGWSRFVAMACLACSLPVAVSGCSDDSGLPICVEGSPPGLPDGPRLTSAPAFAQDEIVDGDQVILFVPVNGQTRSVGAGIRTEDSGGGFSIETEGGTTVEFTFDGPGSPGGLWWTGSIALEGIGSTDTAVYRADDELTTYEFSLEAGEAFTPLCRTPFPPPTFVVTE